MLGFRCVALHRIRFCQLKSSDGPYGVPKKKAWQAEEELQTLKKERRSERSSIQAVEEEKNKRREAEAARAHLEERMQALSRKKKKNALNCF